MGGVEAATVKHFILVFYWPWASEGINEAVSNRTGWRREHICGGEQVESCEWGDNVGYERLVENTIHQMNWSNELSEYSMWNYKTVLFLKKKKKKAWRNMHFQVL